MLYACYDLIRPDVILEMSWRHGLHDFTMVCIGLMESDIGLADTILAVHDQSSLSAECNDRGVEEGQRRAQGSRGVATEAGG